MKQNRPDTSVGPNLVYLRRESLLEDREETVRLTADCDSQGQVLHTVSDVTIGQQLLAQLDLEM